MVTLDVPRPMRRNKTLSDPAVIQVEDLDLMTGAFTRALQIGRAGQGAAEMLEERRDDQQRSAATNIAYAVHGALRERRTVSGEVGGCVYHDAPIFIRPTAANNRQRTRLGANQPNP
jgi:hypothetical protein